MQRILQKLDVPITKNLRAVAKQRAQAEILNKGTAAFEARMLRSEILFADLRGAAFGGGGARATK